MPPNVLTYYKIEEVGGYDPLYSSRYEKFITALEKGDSAVSAPLGYNRIIMPKNIDSPLLPLTNIKYIISLEEIYRYNLKKIMEEGQTKLYEYNLSLPRVYFACTVRSIPDQDIILQELFQIDFIQNKIALVEKAGLVSVQNYDCDSNNVYITDYQPSEVSFDYETSKDSYLIITSQFSPLWKAYLDGKQIRLDKVNYLFMGISVPTGNHAVRLIAGI